MQKYFVDKQLRLANKSIRCFHLKTTTTTMIIRASKPGICRKVSNESPTYTKEKQKHKEEDRSNYNKEVSTKRPSNKKTPRTSAAIGQGKILNNEIDNDETNRGLTTIQLTPNSQHEDPPVESNKVETTKKIRRHYLRRGMELIINPGCSVTEMPSKINYSNRATESESSLTKEEVNNLLGISSKEIISFKKKNNSRSAWSYTCIM